jgi:hypothetical protein
VRVDRVFLDFFDFVILGILGINVIQVLVSGILLHFILKTLYILKTALTDSVLPYARSSFVF